MKELAAFPPGTTLKTFSHTMGTDIPASKDLGIEIISKVVYIRNKNAEAGIQTEPAVYEEAILQCNKIDDSKVRDIAIYAISSLQTGYSLKDKDDVDRMIHEIGEVIPVNSDADVDEFEPRVYNMLVFNVLLSAWQSLYLTNAVLDEIINGEVGTNDMKVVLNYLRGLPVDESQKMHHATKNSKIYFYNTLKETIKICDAISSKSIDEAIHIIAGVQRQHDGYLIEGLGKIYPDGAIISVRYEPDGKSCEVLVVLRGSRTYLGDWFSFRYGGNLNLGLFTDVKEHYGYHLRSSLMYSRIYDEVKKLSKKDGCQRQVNLAFAGHSQGGALAALLARKFERKARRSKSDEALKVARIYLYTFASPTPLRRDPDAYNRSGIRHYRFIEEWDPAPEALRLINLDYGHFGAAIPIPLHNGLWWQAHFLSTYADNIDIEAKSSTTSYLGNCAHTLKPNMLTAEHLRPQIGAVAVLAAVTIVGYRCRHRIMYVAKGAFQWVNTKLPIWRQNK